jgi:hypothetical protein
MDRTFLSVNLTAKMAVIFNIITIKASKTNNSMTMHISCKNHGITVAKVSAILIFAPVK